MEGQRAAILVCVLHMSQKSGRGEEIEQERIAVRREKEEKSRREVEEREKGGRKREKKGGREREGPRTCSSWVKCTGNPDCTPMESTLARCWHRSPHSCPSTAPSMGENQE